MNSGEFLKFLKDFNILGAPHDRRYNERLLTREEAMLVFKRNSMIMKDMDYYQFLGALYDIADLFFNEQFDISNPPENPEFPVVNYSVDQKLDCLLDWIGCDSKKKYVPRMKAYGEPFNCGRLNPRINSNDHSHKYKCRNTQAKKAKIEQ